MRTPDGRECKLYYEDFHRGRSTQECRAEKDPRSAEWQPRDCAKCPVPDILRANSSVNMKITLRIQHPILGIGHKVRVSAYCTKHNIDIKDPYVGCPHCNEERPGLSLFAQALEDFDDD